MQYPYYLVSAILQATLKAKQDEEAWAKIQRAAAEDKRSCTQ